MELFVDNTLLGHVVLASVGNLGRLDFPGMREDEVNVVQTKPRTQNAWEAERA